MTARIVSVPPKLQLSVRSWLHEPCKPSSPIFNDYSRWKSLSQESFFEHESSEKFHAPDGARLSPLCSEVLNSLPNGVLVLSRALELMYWTSKAKSLCERLWQSHETNERLPEVLAELCRRFLRDENRVDQPLLMEYYGEDGNLIRAQVQAVTLGIVDAQSCLLVLVEDCTATLLEEQVLEQKKYELTDREAEVWILLRQEYSYQEISKMLNISMNTVKTHVKKVYAKRKNVARAQRIWYSR